ncbi:MAG TPA: YdcF family protein [Longimicrobiaceae bacterium]|nr:YdcF family protein [Longimicrobiaceae bacterium]
MGRVLLRGLLGLLLLGLGLWLFTLAAVFVFGQRDEARPADTIVVLGAAQYDGRPSPVLRARLDHAIALYRQGLAPTLILTGGVGVGDTVSEAVVGHRYITRAGVPSSAILTERSGLRSVESLGAAAQLMQSRGLQSAILVSDPFHMLRLRLLARRLGFRALSSPTRTSPISRERRREWRFILRESLIIPLMLVHLDV